MVQEDDKFVVHGAAPIVPVPNVSLGKVIFEKLLSNPHQHDAMVDVETGRTISYKELLETTCALAESLRRSGYGKDTIVTICSENNVQFFIPIISALYIGAIIAPVNHNYTDNELAHSIEISKPKIIFCSKLQSRKYISLKNTKDYIEKVIIIDSVEEVYGAETITSFITKTLRGHPVHPYNFHPTELNAHDQVAFIMCSSGTTGLPKGVMLTHTNIMIRFLHSDDPRYSRQSEAPFMGILPFFHAYGLITNLYAMVNNQMIVVFKKFEEERFLRAIQDYKIPILWLAPPLFVFLAKSPLVNKYDLSSVIEIACGAAPLSKETEQIVKKRLKVKAIRQGYGLTEATLAVIMMSVDDENFGSSGKVISYMSCKVRDPETGKSLGPRQVGELCFKGPMVMKGYYNNEEATRNSFTSDGWLLTGDLAYYDENEYFYIVDRLKELIKYKGFQVAPAELEAVLLKHPKIKDVGVVGLPHGDVGELPLAFVVKAANADLNEKEVQKFVEGQVSSQKRLRGGVIFLDAIPKNPSGKILRRELRQLLNKFPVLKSNL